jgi:hypothetical protein
LPRIRINWRVCPLQQSRTGDGICMQILCRGACQNRTDAKICNLDAPPGVSRADSPASGRSVRC